MDAPDTGERERERERSWAGILLGAAPITSLESHSCWLAPSLLTQQHSQPSQGASLGAILKGDFSTLKLASIDNRAT